ncbi:hypothetical protein ABW21_db0200454 [Orbilia brochopaga]|nr:hypothetical protein ABW21_db0200454 [Drechslerella brochopaga]
MAVAIERAPNRPPSYNQVFAISFSFLNDSTHGPESSTAFMTACSDLFSLPPENLITVVIPPGRSAQYSWEHEVVKVARNKARSSSGHHLLIFHYAGHAGKSNVKGEFGLCGRCWEGDAHQLIPWSWAIKKLLESPGESSDLDVLCFLDLCDSVPMVAGEIQGSEDVTTKASAEVLLATERVCSVKAPVEHQASFTEQLVDEMRRRADGDAEPVTVAGLLTELTSRSDPKKPTYRILCGSVPIFLPLRRRESSGPLAGVWSSAMNSFIRPSRSQPRYDLHCALVEITVQITSIATTRPVRMLLDWLAQLPKRYQVQIVTAYDVGGTVIVLSVAYHHLYVMFNLLRNDLISVRVVRDHLFSYNLLRKPIEAPRRGRSPTSRSWQQQPENREPSHRQNATRATRLEHGGGGEPFRQPPPFRNEMGDRRRYPPNAATMISTADDDPDGWNLVTRRDTR